MWPMGLLFKVFIDVLAAGLIKQKLLTPVYCYELVKLMEGVIALGVQYDYKR